MEGGGKCLPSTGVLRKQLRAKSVTQPGSEVFHVPDRRGRLDCRSSDEPKRTLNLGFQGIRSMVEGIPLVHQVNQKQTAGEMSCHARWTVRDNGVRPVHNMLYLQVQVVTNRMAQKEQLVLHLCAQPVRLPPCLSGTRRPRPPSESGRLFPDPCRPRGFRATPYF